MLEALKYKPMLHLQALFQLISLFFKKEADTLQRQAAALLIMLGEDETLQRFLINEINKECQIAAGDADSWNGMAIPFTITGPDNYSSVEEIFEDDPDGEVDDSFDLRMELDQDDVRTKGEKFALAALLEQYDEAEMAELILAFSKPLKAKMQELVPARAHK